MKYGGGIGNKMHMNFDIPTAPPLNVRDQEIKAVKDQPSTCKPYKAYVSATRNEQIAPESCLGQNGQATKIEISNASARLVYMLLISLSLIFKLLHWKLLRKIMLLTIS